MEKQTEQPPLTQRYFVRLSYLGTHFSGWQRQPNNISIQEHLETIFSKILNQPITITGCGRTDAGVHAQNYVAHFDLVGKHLPVTFVRGVNGMLGKDIAVHRVVAVPPHAHARNDATERRYRYHIVVEKNPFQQFTAWYFEQGKKLHLSSMQALADRLLQQRDFYVFCKTDSGLSNFDCHLRTAQWYQQPDGWVFEVAANRFLRGMVRLMVGACVQVGLGKLSLADVESSLANRTILPVSWSVPPEGLMLHRVVYSDEIEQMLY